MRQSLSCGTDSVLDVSGGYHTADVPHAATLAGGLPVRLPGDVGVHLILSMNYSIVKDDPPRGPWKVHTEGYNYELVDSDEKSIVAFHYHPDSRVAAPHLHVGQAADAQFDLFKAHVPTSRVSVEAVLLLSIELGCQPRRDDWAAVLSANEAVFDQWKTW
jgi:hypothetical protein